MGHEYHVSIFDGQNYHLMLFAVLIIPIYAISTLLSSVLQSAERVELSCLPWALGYSILSLIIFYVYHTFFGTLNELKAIRLTLLVACLLTFINVLLIQRYRLIPIKKAPIYLKPKTWLAVSVPMMIAASLQYLMQKLDIFMIEYLVDEVAVGHYAAAQSINNIFYNIQLAITAIYAAKIAKNLNDSPEQHLQTILRGFKHALYVCIPFAVIVFVYGHEILMVFQHDTPLAYNSLIILLFGYIPVALTSSAIVWLQYNGSAKVIMYFLLAAVIINASLNWLLIPIINIEGASAATSIAMILTVIGFVALLYKEFRLLNSKNAVAVS